MRCAIVSDIHSNLVAFQAVLGHLEQAGPIDEIWCLGDVVGYGPAPNQCIELLRSYNHLCIAGNHDWAAIDRIDISEFNPEAATAALWTARQLIPHNRAYIESLPEIAVRGEFTLAHGSPRHPIWEYLTTQSEARAAFGHFAGRYCLVGHSHIPGMFLSDEAAGVSHLDLSSGKAFRLGEGRWILNPGSVGQPRDGDPRASCVVYDTETQEFRYFRTAYDVEATQRHMLSLGLPRLLAERLSYGW